MQVYLYIIISSLHDLPFPTYVMFKLLQLLPCSNFIVPFSYVIWYQKWVTDHSETIVLNTAPLQMTVKTTRSKIPLYDILLSASPKFHLFRSTAKRFRVTGQFETSAPDDPKMTINTERSKWPHMYITNESQISLLSFFALLPDVFKLQTILRQVHRNDSQITWNTTLLEILQNL